MKAKRLRPTRATAPASGRLAPQAFNARLLEWAKCVLPVRPSQALALARRVLDARPRDLQAWDLVVAAHLRMGQLGALVRELESGVQREAPLRVHLALALTAACLEGGDFARAVRWALQAADVAEHREALRTQVRFAPLRKHPLVRRALGRVLRPSGP